MSQDETPVVLELALLPREQMGPFVLLGLEKDASQDEIEAHWAQRVIWARKGQINVPLQDINWARETINDFEKRLRADVTSMNLDTSDAVLRELAERWGVSQSGASGWQPRDVERSLTDYTPPTEVPDINEVRQAINVPELPWEMPGVAHLLEQLTQEPLDPWNLPE